MTRTISGILEIEDNNEMEDIFFWIFVGFLLFGCFMYFQIRKDALWLISGLGISICLVLVVIVTSAINYWFFT